MNGNSIRPLSFPPRGCDPAVALEEVDRYLASDYCYNGGRIFNSICSQPLATGVTAFVRAIASNLADPRIFPGSAALEQVVILWIGSLLGAPMVSGNLVSGGTEANLLAMLAACARHKTRYGVQKQRLQIVAPVSVHYSFDKVAAVLGVEMVRSGLDEHYRADVADLASKINKRTIAVVATAGTSELGAIDDIESISQLAAQHGIHCHVDAATGGFIIPFARHLGHFLSAFDFTLPHVDSMTVDPHKYGLAPIPAGCILFRSHEERGSLNFPSHYVGAPAHTTFSGTRTGAAAAAVAAVIRQLGRDGFAALTRELFHKRDYLVSRLEQRGWPLLIAPQLSIVAIPCANPEKTLADLQDLGWIVSLSKRNRAIRLVIHHHIDKASINAFVEAFSTTAQPVGESSNARAPHLGQ